MYKFYIKYPTYNNQIQNKLNEIQVTAKFNYAFKI